MCIRDRKRTLGVEDFYCKKMFEKETDDPEMKRTVQILLDEDRVTAGANTSLRSDLDYSPLGEFLTDQPSPSDLHAVCDSKDDAFLEIDDFPSKVLYVGDITDSRLTAMNLRNIFSNFASVKAVYIFRSLRGAFVECESTQDASLARLSLDGLSLLTAQLRIAFSPYNRISDDTSLLDELEEADVFFDNSYKNQASRKTFIAPSETLHVSNLAPDACTPGLLNLFAPFGNVITYRFLHLPPKKNMCLIRFATIDQALTAIAFLHDYIYLGRNLQLSFSRSKV
eukprot:TRINITY_DN12319_c0_g1_i5.p1 TRINITY_DN12319_c0_g1~~TRINITY_DN12319_c0_g1_i5.p1  ORF type:complete len:301 (-),score=62.48 TRINITY_DN12319_c0_g1_i5:192-1037(-)